jgi:Outer membrane protein beta-barrel domain
MVEEHMKRQRLDIAIAALAVVALYYVASAREARADRGEASVHAEVQYGRATVGEPDAPDDTDDAPFSGVGARATYAISNWYAVEASLGYGQLRDWTVYTVDTTQGAVMRHWYQTWIQAELGITARFGVRIIPTLHAALGAQRRTWQGGRQLTDGSSVCVEPPEMVSNLEPADPCIGTPPARASPELVGTLGAGLDYRLGDHWITGLSVTAQRAALAEAPFHAIAVTFHFSYYFYPEGAGP